jgi:hypothetical protein
MKTILDNHTELYLDSLYEREELICKLLTFKLEKGNRKIPDFEGAKYEIHFKDVNDYFVLQEITHVALGLDYLDNGHLTECKSSDISEVLKIQNIFSDNEIKHYVLRTAHCAVHVFTPTKPIILKM